MGGGSSKGKTSASSSTSVWGAQAGFLGDMFSRAEGLYNQGNYQYGMDRVAGFQDPMRQSIGAANDQYGMGRGDLNMARQENNRTMSGDRLGPENNPWLQRTHDIGARNMTRSFYGATNALGSRMEASGRTGGGSHGSGTNVTEENFATGMGDFDAALYGGNYERERGYQNQAIGQAGAINQAGWQNVGGQAQSAERQLGQRQLELDDMVGRFQQQQMGSAEKLAEFSKMIGAPIMTQKSTSKGKEKSSEGGVF